MPMSSEDPLLTVLACPIDKGPLILLGPEESLYNSRLRRRYPIVNGIPQLLPSSGEPVGAEEHSRLLKRINTPGAVGRRPRSTCRPIPGDHVSSGRPDAAP